MENNSISVPTVGKGWVGCERSVAAGWLAGWGRWLVVNVLEGRSSVYYSVVYSTVGAGCRRVGSGAQGGGACIDEVVRGVGVLALTRGRRGGAGSMEACW